MLTALIYKISLKTSRANKKTSPRQKTKVNHKVAAFKFLKTFLTNIRHKHSSRMLVVNAHRKRLLRMILVNARHKRSSQTLNLKDPYTYCSKSNDLEEPLLSFN